MRDGWSVKYFNTAEFVVNLIVFKGSNNIDMKKDDLGDDDYLYIGNLYHI